VRKCSVFRPAGRLVFLLAIALSVFSSMNTLCSSTADDERNIERFAVKRVQPPYPPLAQKYKIEGIVTVQVLVSTDGRVSKAEFVRGHNIFRSVALDAAKRWEFKANESLEGTIRFTFKLGQ
jgi:TonB family protein